MYKLPGLSVFIDNQYTVVYWGGGLDLYALFKIKSPGAWTVAKHLLPLPDKVFNADIRRVSAQRNPTVTHISSEDSQALFDKTDIF